MPAAYCLDVWLPKRRIHKVLTVNIEILELI